MGTEYTLASHQIPRGPSEVLSPGPGDSESIKSVIVPGIVYPMVLPADTYYNSAWKPLDFHEILGNFGNELSSKNSEEPGNYFVESREFVALTCISNQ